MIIKKYYILKYRIGRKSFPGFLGSFTGKMFVQRLICPVETHSKHTILTGRGAEISVLMLSHRQEAIRRPKHGIIIMAQYFSKKFRRLVDWSTILRAVTPQLLDFRFFLSFPARYVRI